METIKLKKRWGGYKAGDTFHVLGDGIVLRRDGSVYDQRSGKEISGRAVDSQRAQQLKSDGFLDEGRRKKSKRKGK